MSESFSTVLKAVEGCWKIFFDLSLSLPLIPIIVSLFVIWSVYRFLLSPVLSTFIGSGASDIVHSFKGDKKYIESVTRTKNADGSTSRTYKFK